MNEDDRILEIKGVEKRFGAIVAVADATFGVERGSITALIGPNGAGKSTLFSVISGFYRAERGHVQFQGRPINHKPPHVICEAGLVRTFQTPKVFTKLSVLDNMLVAAQRHPGERISSLLLRPRANHRREHEVRDRAAELLKLIRLDDKAAQYAGNLSGGQRKLLEFGRALMTEPAMIMLDEPMAGVNPTLRSQLLDHITTLRREGQLTFLFIEHEMDVVMSMSDRVIVMSQGAVISDGPPAVVRQDPRVADAYLGTQTIQRLGSSHE